jgi:hypothetical protein
MLDSALHLFFVSHPHAFAHASNRHTAAPALADILKAVPISVSPTGAMAIDKAE